MTTKNIIKLGYKFAQKYMPGTKEEEDKELKEEEDKELLNEILYLLNRIKEDANLDYRRIKNEGLEALEDMRDNSNVNDAFFSLHFNMEKLEKLEKQYVSKSQKIGLIDRYGDEDEDEY